MFAVPATLITSGFAMEKKLNTVANYDRRAESN